MRIALLGGTGDIGEGLALRWAYDTEYDLVIGSREADRARTKAAEYETELASRGLDRSLDAAINDEAVDGADLVVLSIPPYFVADTIESVAPGLADDAILVSPAVGLSRDDDGFHYDPPPAGSVAAHAAEAAPDDVPLVGAFHTLPADLLANLDVPIEQDTPIVGDDPDAVETVRTIANAIDGLRGIPAGGLAMAPLVESLTPLLINVAHNNAGVHDAGVRFTWP